MRSSYRIFIIILAVLISNNSVCQNYWGQTNGPFFDSSTVYAKVFSMTADSSDYIYAGTNNGIYLTTDFGGNWAQKSNELNGLTVPALAVNSGNDVFACSEQNGIFKSTDGGESWTNSGLNGSYYLTSISLNSSNDIFVGAWGMNFGEGGIFRSTDNGTNWIHVINGMNATNVYSVSVDVQNDLFAGTNSGIYKSTNNGDSWFNITSGYITSGVNSIVINSDGYIFAGTLNGLFRSTDDGETWQAINNGLSTTIILCLEISLNDLIFVGTNLGGAFYSIDNGDNWIEINGGLTDYNVESLVIDSGGFVYAGTLSKGVFRSINSIITSTDDEYSKNPAYSLFQNYPNPFNPTTKIKYQLPELGKVRLTVYDVLGREVRTLVNEEKPAGSYEVEFNGTGLPSGVYFYRIDAGKYSDTKKFVLLK